MRPESLIPKSAVATAPQRCELFVNYFTVLLTGSGSFAAGILVGIPNYFSSYLLLRALQLFPATVVYPTYSTATILLVMGLSALFFREHLTKRQRRGVLLILIALALLNQ